MIDKIHCYAFAQDSRVIYYEIVVKLKGGFTGERALVFPRIIVDKTEEDSLTPMSHITDIGYYPKAKHHFRERRESINQYVFIYCIGEVGWYHIDNQEYTVSANQYFILPTGVPRAYAFDKLYPWTIYWMHFKGTLAPSYTQEVGRPMDIQPESHSRISTRISLFEEIFNTLRNGYSNKNLHHAFSMFYFYLGTLRYIRQFRNVTANNDVAEGENVSELATHRMKKNMEKRLSLQDITDQIGYPPSYFSLLFRKKTGYSPLTYFNLLKIQQSCQLLDTIDMRVNQTYYKIGIEDIHYFSRLFSKIMRMSPREYRKSRKG